MAASANPWSPKGRLAPRPYWINIGIIFAIRIVAVIVLEFRPDWDIFRHLDYLLFFVAILVGKRLKDSGVPPYWGWLAVAVISFVIPIVAITVWPQPHDPDHPLNLFPPLMVLVVGICMTVLVVAVGLRKGDIGENRYGPAPT